MKNFSSSTVNAVGKQKQNSRSHLFKNFPRINMHRAWSLFLLYYAVTYVACFSLLIYFFGYYPIAIVIVSLVALQALRVVPGLRKIPLFFNYWAFLWVYRVNYLSTLIISLALCLAPFVASVYTMNYFYGMTAAVILGVAFFIGVLYIQHWRTNSDAKASQPKVNTPGKVHKKKVAIIGGGVAGIVAAKECMQEGHDVVVYEHASQLGGVWNSDDSVSKRTTGRTLSSSSRYNSFFGDFPMNLDVDKNSYAGKTYPSHYSEEDYRNYLKEYTKHFDIEKLLKFNTYVAKTERNDDGKWLVTIKDKDGNQSTVEHDFVIVSTGLNHQTQGLNLSQNKKANSAEIAHSAKYRDNEEYRDKKVVIVGMGESSSDLAADIADVAKEVHIIVRNPVLLLPRNTFGQKIAPDHKLSRLILTCPQYMRTFKLLSQTAMHGPLNWVASKLLGLNNVFGSTVDDSEDYDDNWSWEWWKLFYKLGYLHPKARWGITRGQVTKTAPIVKAYRQGKLHFHTVGIKDNLDSLILLEDGTRIENVDAVVNATGYQPVWPFLPDSHSKHETKNRYRMVFHPELPDMAFIGFCRGAVGSVMQAMEMQSRWVALVVSEKRLIPQKEQMQALIEKHKKQMIGKWPTKVTMVYANAIAREEVGCEPRLADVFRLSPRTWYYLMTGPYCMAMYRFRGPHSNPDLAKSVYQKSPQLVWPLEFHLQHILEFSLGYLTRFWSSVPPLKYIKKKSLACRVFATPFIDLEY